MTTHANKDGTTFSCDDCSEAFEPEPLTEDFSEAWSQARAAGWRVTQIKGVWNHFCPACVEEFKG